MMMPDRQSTYLNVQYFIWYNSGAFNVIMVKQFYTSPAKQCHSNNYDSSLTLLGLYKCQARTNWHFQNRTVSPNICNEYSFIGPDLLL